jgi:hypothetical protein
MNKDFKTLEGEFMGVHKEFRERVGNLFARYQVEGYGGLEEDIYEEAGKPLLESLVNFMHIIKTYEKYKGPLK